MEQRVAIINDPN
jgi:hypothetical protein